MNIFERGIKNEFHSGSQLKPLADYKSSRLQEVFIARCVLKDFESGYILGPFPSNTRFIKFPFPPPTKRNQSVGRAVFDLKRSGYNLGIKDSEAFVLLPKFHEVVNLLRHNSYACIFDLKNADRQ